ncbi:MAG: AbrB/MazE/SpoVT family DNA-binding domain-containing protein [Desulfohalobiaceae bacterium]
MGHKLTLSQKGQITLPADIRNKLGLAAGDTLIAEERNGELILRPATILEIELYRGEDIARWDEEDRLDPQTRHNIVNKLETKS